MWPNSSSGARDILGYSAGEMLWIGGFQISAVLVGIVAALLEMYVILSG